MTKVENDSDRLPRSNQRAARAHDQAPRDRAGTLVGQAGRYGVLILGVALVALFSALKPATFATWDNYRSILDNQSITTLLALAVLVPLIVGHFDLSVAGVLAMSQVLAVGLISQHGLSIPLAIFLTLLVGLAFGAVNAVLVVRFHVTSVVATLATASVASAVSLWYTGGQTLFSHVPRSFTDLARVRPAGMPITFIYVAVIALAMWATFTWLPVGRRLYATGGNVRAAAFGGIRTQRYVVGAFLSSALLASIAGVVLGARLGSAEASTGSDLLLPAIAGAFLGATTIRPGHFNALGTVVAVYTLSIAVSGLQQLGAPIWVQPLFNGLALAIAVAVSGWAVRARETRARLRQLRLLEVAASDA